VSARVLRRGHREPGHHGRDARELCVVARHHGSADLAGGQADQEIVQPPEAITRSRPVEQPKRRPASSNALAEGEICRVAGKAARIRSTATRRVRVSAPNESSNSTTDDRKRIRPLTDPKTQLGDNAARRVRAALFPLRTHEDAPFGARRFAALAFAVAATVSLFGELGMWMSDDAHRARRHVRRQAARRHGSFVLSERVAKRSHWLRAMPGVALVEFAAFALVVGAPVGFAATSSIPGNTMPRIWSESPRVSPSAATRSLTVAEWASESVDADRETRAPQRAGRGPEPFGLSTAPRANGAQSSSCTGLRDSIAAASSRATSTVIASRRGMGRAISDGHRSRRVRAPVEGDAATWKPPSALSPPPHATARRTSCQRTGHRRSPWRSLPSLVEGPRDGGAPAGRSVPRRSSGSE